MAVFGLRYDRLTLPLAVLTGTGPGLAYVDVDTPEGMFRFRLGVWLRLDAPLDRIEHVTVEDEPGRIGFTSRIDLSAGRQVLMVRTGPGPMTVVHFTRPTSVEWLVKPSRRGLFVTTKQPLAAIGFTASEPEKIRNALASLQRRSTPASTRRTTKAASRTTRAKV